VKSLEQKIFTKKNIEKLATYIKKVTDSEAKAREDETYSILFQVNKIFTNRQWRYRLRGAIFNEFEKEQFKKLTDGFEK